MRFQARINGLYNMPNIFPPNITPKQNSEEDGAHVTETQMVRHLFGNFHQGCGFLQPFNGLQCTAIALLGLFMFMQHMPNLSNIRSSDLDQVIINGTDLYRYVTQTSGQRGYLSHRDLPTNLQDWNEQLPGDIEYHFDRFYGPVNGLLNLDAGQSSFVDAFLNAISISSYQIVTFGESTVAVYYSYESSMVYVFDSHQRNENGFPDPNGNSVILSFDCIDEFVHYVFSIYINSLYEITPVYLPWPTCNMHSDTSSKSMNKRKKFNQTKPCQQKCNANGINLSKSSNKVHENGENFLRTFHSYSKLQDSEKKCKQTRRKRRKKSVIGQIHDNLNYSKDDTNFSYIFSNFLLQDHINYPMSNPLVSDFITVVNDTTIDFLSDENHNKEYEINIRKTPCFACRSCDRILFSDQVFHIKGETQVMSSVFTNNDDLCQFCHSKIVKKQMPYLCSKENFLDIGNIPHELACLSKVEKRLVSLIQVFMIIIILPGGQFCEKGLVLNLPTNVQSIASQLPNNIDNESLMVVHYLYEHGYAAANDFKIFVNPSKVRRALMWLKENNALYSDVKINMSNTFHNSTSANESSHFLDNFETCSLTPLNISVPDINITDCYSKSTLVVPKINDSPVHVYEIDFGEERAFPWLFPRGLHGFRFKRPLNIPRAMYFKHRLYNKDGVFRKNMTYLLHAAVSVDVALLKSEISINMRMRKSESNLAVTAADVKNIQDNSSLRENSYMFMKNIRGTVAYFRNQLYNLLSMFKTIGPPTIFMTLSADDLHWPELGMSLYGVGYDEAVKLNNFEGVKSDSLLTATHFERRFKSLMKYIILDGPKPLGEVTDYFARVEFQNRGSPHIHMFLWVKDLPGDLNGVSVTALENYIENTIFSTTPNENFDKELHQLVRRLQVHSHTTYCSKHYSSRCRFGFPKVECSKTKVFNNINFSSKNKGKFYETVRTSTDTMINCYNPVILRHWRANMDIQLICNAEGAAYYVCSYICKSEPDELKSALGKLIHQVFKENPSLPKHVKLYRIGLTVLRHRRLSSQEAAYRLSNLNLIHTSRRFIFINARPQNKRFKILKSKKDIENLPDNSTEVFHSNIIDYYQNRPNNANMNDMCLYRFSAWYEKCYSPPSHRAILERIFIRNYDIWMKKCKTPYIVRYPNFAPSTDDYFFSLLILLVPHRTEIELIVPFSNARSAFLNRRHLIDQNIDFSYFSFTEQIENTVRRIILSDDLNSQDINGSSNCNITHNEDANLRLELEEMFFQKISESDLHNSGNHSCEDDSFSDELHMHSLFCPMSVDEFHENVAKMTPSQKRALDYIHLKFKEKSCPFHLFISGGAGVGKTFSSKIIVAYLQLFHSVILSTNPVIVCAPTGTAANNINGRTLHSVFKIPVGPFLKYSSLSNLSLKNLRKQFETVHTIVIDEISMVSSEMLIFISRRLSEIKDCESVFGGLNIIVIGDFFQLRPVKGSFSFTNSLIWHLFDAVFLKENVRQSTDTSYFQLLNRVRFGIPNEGDISILKSRLISEERNMSMHLHIFPKRTNVDNYNDKQLNKLQDIKTFRAVHFFSNNDVNPMGEVDESYILIDDQIAGGLRNVLRLSIGARVMLIRNIFTERGLVNGALGVVTGFQFCESVLKAILVKFDDPNVGKISSCNLIENVHEPIPIEQVEHEFIHSGRHIVRLQFPLALSWGCTIHKVQGLSLNSAVIDLGSSVFDFGMAYVALSRIRTLSGLFLLKFDPTKIKASDVVLKEYERLKNGS